MCLVLFLLILIFIFICFVIVDLEALFKVRNVFYYLTKKVRIPYLKKSLQIDCFNSNLHILKEWRKMA